MIEKIVMAVLAAVGIALAFIGLGGRFL